MWFLPVLLVGAIAVALAKRSSRKAAPPSRQLAAGPPVLPGPVAVGRQGLPGPIAVLGEILRVGKTPSPTVIICAIAEARSIGRDDLVSDIVRVFILPVVLHHQRMRARGARPADANYERGSCAVLRAPRYAAEAAYAAPAAAPFEAAFHSSPPFDPAYHSSPPAGPRTEPSAPKAPSDFMADPAQSSLPVASMDDEISALLNADPVRFMDMVSRGAFPTVAQQAPQQVAVPAPPPPPPSASMPPPAPPIVQPTGLPAETVAQMQEAAGMPEAADRTRSLAPGSPIASIPDTSWRDFVVRLEREAPTFNSSRHVGQYRQRRERLAELGIDPRAIQGSPPAQRSALDADLANAHEHAAAGGLLEHLGRGITVPGHEGCETVTLSGVLGVIQCAGLDGAVGWLERPNDRKRYPHTTQAFLNTNGVF